MIRMPKRVIGLLALLMVAGCESTPESKTALPAPAPSAAPASSAAKPAAPVALQQLAFAAWLPDTTPNDGFGAYTYLILTGAEMGKELRILRAALERGQDADTVAPAAKKQFNLFLMPTAAKPKVLWQSLDERAAQLRDQNDGNRAKAVLQWACNALKARGHCVGGPFLVTTTKPLTVKDGLVSAPKGTRVALAKCRCDDDAQAAEVLDKAMSPDFGRNGAPYEDMGTRLMIAVITNVGGVRRVHM